ncbi:tripartite motif-containing protein 55-like [Saccostrea echinata]|uniref:tripartite motif-containing protein 55-like n=1 Tax=Saccostrea echinata TaxID=191078 RepID=UPI002A82EEF1|nr:tripartite motif-containing protein 55-like [Saccostrea echinata]
MAGFVYEPDVTEAFLTCSICEDDYKEPVGLPCLHSFCKECISRHIIESTKGQKAARGFNCPKCKRQIDAPDPQQAPHYWVESFPVNHFVKSLMENVRLRTEERKCDPCSRRNDSIIAMKWCKECSEAYCEQCESFHKSLKYSQHHNLISMIDLQHQPIKDTANRPPCPDHEGTELAFFCEDHNQVVCSSCVTLDHRKCLNVTSCEEAADKQRLKTDAIIDKLKMQRDWANRISENRKHSSKTLEDASFQLRQQIAGLRQQMNDLLKSKEYKLTEEIKNIKIQEKNNYDSDIDSCDGIASTTDNALSLLQNTLKHGSDTDVLLMVDKVKHEAHVCENTLSDITRQMKDVFMNFTPDKQLQAISTTLRDIGKITVTYTPVHIAPPYNLENSNEEHPIEDESIAFRSIPSSPLSTRKSPPPPLSMKKASPPISSRKSPPTFFGSGNNIHTARLSPIPSVRSRKSPRYEDVKHPDSAQTPLPPLILPPKSVSPIHRVAPKQATMDYFFKARTIQDRENCCFTGAEFIGNSRIILIDQNHRKIKLFNKEYKWVGEKVLSAKPYDIAIISGNEVAVSLPPDKKIYIYQVRENDCLGISTIQTGAKCWGIAFANKKFAVCCYSQPPCIKMMSQDGRELKIICKDQEDHDLFSFPDYIAMDKSAKNLFVTDKYKGSVIAVTTSGEKRWEFRDEGLLKNPKGIAVLGTRVYVAGCKSHNVLLMTTDGDVIGNMISDGISNPHKIALHSDGDHLMVTQYQSTLVDVEKNMIKVFTVY